MQIVIALTESFRRRIGKRANEFGLSPEAYVRRAVLFALTCPPREMLEEFWKLLAQMNATSDEPGDIDATK